jgi:hypothetical protein
MANTRDMINAAQLVHLGLAQLRTAVDEGDIDDWDYILRLVHDHSARDAGLLHAMKQLLDGVWDQVTNLGDEHADKAVDWLTQAANSVEDRVGEDIDRAREQLARIDSAREGLPRAPLPHQP